MLINEWNYDIFDKDFNDIICLDLFCWKSFHEEAFEKG